MNAVFGRASSRGLAAIAAAARRPAATAGLELCR
jgi:hypothetical protein